MVFVLNPFKIHSNDVLVICPKNKPFFAETLKAGKAVAEPPKMGVGKAFFTHKTKSVNHFHKVCRHDHRPFWY